MASALAARAGSGGVNMIAATSGDYARSSIVLSLAIMAEYLFRFVQKMIVARLMLPESFGLMGAVIAAVSALEAIADLGLRQSVIQHKRGGEEGYLNTVWIVSVVRGVVLTLVAMGLAPWCAIYFQAPDAADLFRAGFAGILISSLISPRVFLLEKQFKFGTWAMVMQAGAFGGSLSTIVLAFFFRNAWALVAGHLVELMLRVALSYVWCPFRPRWRAERDAVREVFRFSRGMIGLSALTMISLQVDLLFLGRMASLPVLGCYVMAKTLSEVLSFLSLKIINPVFLPGMARLKDEPERMATGLYRGTEAAVLFILPIMSWMVLSAKPLLILAYGEAYGIAAGAFAVLCVSTFIFSCSSLFMIMFIALGQPGHQRKAALIRLIGLAACMFPLIHYGELTGAATALSASGLVMLTVQYILAARLVPLRWKEYLVAFVPGIRLAALGVLAPWLVGHALIPGDDLAILWVSALGAAIALMIAIHAMWRRHDLPGLSGLLAIKPA